MKPIIKLSVCVMSLLVIGVLGVFIPEEVDASSISIGFESAEGYVLGPISDTDGGQIQAGWSGGAQTYFTNDSTDLEQVVNTEAHSGSNSWHAARFYGSEGQGTPFSPSLGLASGTGPGTTFTAEIFFKAGSSTGDGSTQNIYLGSYAGDDRTGFNVYLRNDSSGDGLHLYTYEWNNGGFVSTVFSKNLDRTTWHKLNITAVFDAVDPSLDSYTYTVDDVDTFTGNSWPNPWRISNGFTPVWGDQLKFADSNGDNGTDLGFYYDDITYSSSPNSVVVPLPAAVWAGMPLLGCLVGVKLRRRKE